MLADLEALSSAHRDRNSNRRYHDWCLRGSGVFCLQCTKGNLAQEPDFFWFSRIKRDRRHCEFSHLQPRDPRPDLQYPCKQAKSSSPQRVTISLLLQFLPFDSLVHRNLFGVGCPMPWKLPGNCANTPAGELSRYSGEPSG